MQRFLSTFILLAVSCAGTAAWSQSTRGSTSKKGWSRTQLNLRQLLGPARERGYQRNTSAAFAATALVESLIRAENDEVVQLSPEWAFTQGRGHILAPASPLRSYYQRVDDLPAYAAVLALETGILLESEWPYNSQPHPQGRITYTPPPALNFLKKYRFVHEPVALDRAGEFILVENRAVVVSLWWYPRHVSSRGTITLPMPSEREACDRDRTGCLPFTVLLVGYNRETRDFVFRNASGERWGNQGYGTLPEESIIRDCLGCYGEWSKASFDSVRLLSTGFSGRLIETGGSTVKGVLRPRP